MREEGHREDFVRLSAVAIARRNDINAEKQPKHPNTMNVCLYNFRILPTDFPINLNINVSINIHINSRINIKDSYLVFIDINNYIKLKLILILVLYKFID